MKPASRRGIQRSKGNSKTPLRVFLLSALLCCLSTAVFSQTATSGPTITTQPVSQTVADGNNATFSVSATGAKPLKYAWQYLTKTEWMPFKTGSGYNTATFTTAATTEREDGFQIRVVVTDANGHSTISNDVILTVLNIRLTGISCTNASMTGSGTDSCKVSLNIPAPKGGVAVSLRSSCVEVGVPTSVTVPANAASVAFNAAVSPVAAPTTVKLSAISGGVTETFSLSLGGVPPTLALATSGSPSTYSKAVTLTATITGGITGNITFLNGTTVLGIEPISGTTATLTTSTLPAGSHAITAHWPGNSTFAPLTSSAITQVVNKDTPAITWPTPAAISYGTALSGAQLDATTTAAGTMNYSDPIGTVLSVGSHSITATFTPSDTADYNSATKTITLTVNPAVPVIQWASPAPITYGTPLSSTQLDATANVAGTFTYSPAAGTVLPAGAQTLSVTFTPTDANDYKTVKLAVPATVEQATPVITWATPAPITYGTAISATQLDASAAIPGAFTYSVSVGRVLIAGNHTLTATFTPADTTDYKTVYANVTLTVNQATPGITWPTPAPVVSGTTLSSTQLDATATVAGSFVYTPAAGTVLSAGSQTLSVTFTPTDTTDFTTATASVTLTVKTGTQTVPPIVWTPPAAITYGTPLSSAQLNASTSVAGTFVYTPAAGTVLTAGIQTLSVTFIPTNSAAYSQVTATVSLTVNQAVPVIQWASPAAITYGTPLSASQLNATTTVAGTFSYSPGIGKILLAGVRNLSVTFTPNDSTDYQSATTVVTITVNQATPSIIWPTPTAITSGTALSATQLNATSNVPGVFTYSPAAGTVLNSGSQTLSVTLTPTDSTNYAVATASVILTVTPNTGVPTLAINTTSVAFGNVALNTPSTQSLTLSSTGTSSVTINSAVISGIGYSLPNLTLPMTLAPGQTATLGIQFDPTVLGVAAGVLTINSTSSTNSTVVIILTGTGTSAAYAVELTWDAPDSTSDPLAGYNIFRAPGGSTTYQLLNSSVDALTTFTDSSVQSGQSYNYIVESIDDSGVPSAPSSPILVTVP